MTVKSKKNILGKGWVLICEGEFYKVGLKKNVVVKGKDKNTTFTITGYGHFIGFKNYEIILSPQDNVGKFIEVGNEIEILDQ